MPDARARRSRLLMRPSRSRRVLDVCWSGLAKAGVRLYSAGQPGGARADRLLHQARLALDPDARLKVVRKMYDMRSASPHRSAGPSISSGGSRGRE